MENKYTHLERLSNPEVNGILNGEIYCYPKLDGANTSIEFIDGEICFRSRKRILSGENTLKGFVNYCVENPDNYYQLNNFFLQYPEIIIFGEWLIPHSIKYYKHEAWNKFYIFDFYNKSTNTYLNFESCREKFSNLLQNYEFVPLLKSFKNLNNQDILLNLSKSNNYLLDSKSLIGEGIVIKNYSFVNKYGRIAFAKLINERTHTHTITTEKNISPEKLLLDKYLSNEYILKEINKINEPHRNVPTVINTIFYEFIRDYILEIVGTEKNLSIDFKNLKKEISNIIRDTLFIKK